MTGYQFTAGMPVGFKAVDIRAIERQAFAEAPTRPGLNAAQTMPVKVLPGETLEAAVRRTGIDPAEAKAVVRTLAQAFDTVNIKAGLAFQAAIAKPRGRGGPAQLIGLSMRTGPASALTLSRTFDGALHLRELDEQVRDETTVAQGQIDGSLYESAMAAGADPKLTAEVVKLFAKKLDFARDLHPNDEFRLVFDRKVTENGRTVETGQLLYAEIGAKGQVTRFFSASSTTARPSTSTNSARTSKASSCARRSMRCASPRASACACIPSWATPACTRASTSPRPRARRSTPPATG